MATARSLSKFDQEDHPSDAYGAFCEFVEEFQYEYDAVAKDPPRDLDATQTAKLGGTAQTENVHWYICV